MPRLEEEGRGQIEEERGQGERKEKRQTDETRHKSAQTEKEWRGGQQNRPEERRGAERRGWGEEGGTDLDDAANLGLETHVKHAISLVEREEHHVRQLDLRASTSECLSAPARQGNGGASTESVFTTHGGTGRWSSVRGRG
eukprot:1435586-Rhodomonas_salina.2